MKPGEWLSDQPASGSWFATTHWSVVLAAGEETSAGSTQALERLCSTYWKPLYAYVRRYGHDTHEAEDLTQEFFARLLARESISVADPARGRFRTFLLSSLQNFLRNEWKRAQREKRGGGKPVLSLDAKRAEAEYSLEPVDDLTPERLFERRWAMTLLEQVLARVRADYKAAGTMALFDELKDYIWGEQNTTSYAGMGTRLGMSEGAVKVAAHRLRRRYRELLRDEIAQTVAHPQEVDDELRHLISIISE